MGKLSPIIMIIMYCNQWMQGLPISSHSKIFFPVTSCGPICQFTHSSSLHHKFPQHPHIHFLTRKPLIYPHLLNESAYSNSLPVTLINMCDSLGLLKKVQLTFIIYGTNFRIIMLVMEDI